MRVIDLLRDVIEDLDEFMKTDDGGDVVIIYEPATARLFRFESNPHDFGTEEEFMKLPIDNPITQYVNDIFWNFSDMNISTVSFKPVDEMDDFRIFIDGLFIKTLGDVVFRIDHYSEIVINELHVVSVSDHPSRFELISPSSTSIMSKVSANFQNGAIDHQNHALEYGSFVIGRGVRVNKLNNMQSSRMTVMEEDSKTDRLEVVNYNPVRSNFVLKGWDFSKFAHEIGNSSSTKGGFGMFFKDCRACVVLSAKVVEDRRNTYINCSLDFVGSGRFCFSADHFTKSTFNGDRNSNITLDISGTLRKCRFSGFDSINIIGHTFKPIFIYKCHFIDMVSITTPSSDSTELYFVSTEFERVGGLVRLKLNECSVSCDNVFYCHLIPSIEISHSNGFFFERSKRHTELVLTGERDRASIEKLQTDFNRMCVIYTFLGVEISPEDISLIGDC